MITGNSFAVVVIFGAARILLVLFLIFLIEITKTKLGTILLNAIIFQLSFIKKFSTLNEKKHG